MKELIEMLSGQIRYKAHEIRDKEIEIHIESKREEAECPYCGENSSKAHSRYQRKLQDLPLQGKKVRLVINRRKYFCDNAACPHGTFVEAFDFFDGKATKTHRLQEEILRVALTQSSTAAARYLRASVADVGKSSICNLVKKGRKKEC